MVQRELEDMQRMGAMALMEGDLPLMFAPMVPPGSLPGMPYPGHGAHSRNPRRDRGPRGGGGQRYSHDNRGAEGSRKRGRDEEQQPMQEDGPQKGPGSTLPEGDARRNESVSTERQKNPRFRERGDDSDEEDKA